MIKKYTMELSVYLKQKDKQFPRKLDSLLQKFRDDVWDLKNCVQDNKYPMAGCDDFHKVSGAKLPDYMKD